MTNFIKSEKNLEKSLTGLNDHNDNHGNDVIDNQTYQCLKDIKLSQQSDEGDQNKNFTLLLIEEYIKELEIIRSHYVDSNNNIR